MDELFSQHVFSVGEMTELIKRTLELSFHSLTVEGEISNFRPASSGHWYFQLNDNEASLQAVMFKQKSWRLPFKPKDGDRVVVTGNISVYAKRGTYQIICETMRQSGTGDILLMLERRKQEFAAAGYFDQGRKRPLPRHPGRVGIVTSPTGAALGDILRTLQRRNRMIDVIILPTLVQGEGAAPMIAAQIEAANRFALADVLIVGRGGGSMEDLLPFSERVVVEAIVASRIPVVSAVGHEIDWALCDWAADERASTPTAAAELISSFWEQVVADVSNSVETWQSIMRNRLSAARQGARFFSPQRMEEYMTRRIGQSRLAADDNREMLMVAMQQRLAACRHAKDVLLARLESLSPLAVLDRGYAIVTMQETRAVVRDVAQVSAGDLLHIRFAKGSALARTEELGNGRKEESR